MKAAAMRIGSRLGLVLGLVALAALGIAAPAFAIKSVQKFTLSAQPAVANDATPTARIGEGAALAKGLGLEQPLVLQAFNSPGGPTLLVTGQSPLIIHEVALGTLTPLPGDPTYSYRLSFAFPRGVQNPAPGVIAALTDFQLTIPARVTKVGDASAPLFATVGCSGMQYARYSADFSTSFDGAIESTQTVDITQPCPATLSVAPVSISIHSWFDDIGADLADAGFSPVNVNVYLPRDIVANLSQLPTCAPATILSNESTCPAGPPAVVGPQVTAPPPPPSKVSVTRPARGLLLVKHGRTAVTVTLNGAGTIAVVVKAKSGRQTLVVAKGAATTKAAGKLRIPLALTRLGKDLVKNAGRKGLRVSLTAAGTVTGRRPATSVVSLRVRG